MTSTRITPGQLLPDVGGMYRHRETGVVRKLAYILRGVYLVETPSGTLKKYEESEFWNRWIHADAGAVGRGAM